MKIALVSPYDFPYPGGVTEHIMAIATGARQRGHTVQILAACSGYQSEPFPDTQPVTRCVTAIPIAGAIARVGLSPLSYFRLKKILQREAFDVIHLHEPLTPSLTWWVLLQAQTMLNTVTIGTFHAYHERPNPFYRHGRPIFAKFFKRVDKLIAVSSAARNFAYQMFPGDYQIIPNGIDLSRFEPAGLRQLQPRLPDPDKKVTILFVGRLDKRKGFLYLLEAFIMLKQEYPQLQLEVVGPFGPGECEPYQSLVQMHGITDVRFVGYVSPAELPHFYRKADIFCAPSLGFESFGIVLLEAMASGLPIVASDIVGYRSVMTDGQEGLLAPPGQARPLAGALHHLLDKPWLRWEMGQRGRLKASHYSWDEIIDQILAVYIDALELKIKIHRQKLGQAEAALSSYCHV